MVMHEDYLWSRLKGIPNEPTKEKNLICAILSILRRELKVHRLRQAERKNQHIHEILEAGDIVG